ncbi:hypothetical protein BDZ91DRAFT_634617, partial [Kalaharituber pfeilii]
PSQWRTFMSIADTLFPALSDSEADAIIAAVPSGPQHRAAIQRFLSRNASECREFMEALDHAFAHRLPKRAVGDVKMVLNLLNGGIFTLLLTRHYASFSSLPLPSRVKVLQNWSQSYLPLLRTLHRQLQLIFSNTILRTDPLLISALGYPSLSSNPPQNSPSLPPPGEFHTPNFYPLPNDDDSAADVVELTTDILIVGSGSGGGVCAARIARELCPEGYSVTIVDKGTFIPPTHFPMSETTTARLAFDNNGVIPSTDGNGLMVASSNWGGGTTINWGLSLDLEPPVVKEWSDKGMKNVVESSEWSDCIATVLSRMGVSAPQPEKHLNEPNKIIWEGAKRLGLDPRTIPQNNGGRMDEHANCGQCSSGCRSGCKQGCAVSWLVDAERAGARCISGVEVVKLLWDTERSTKDEKVARGARKRPIRILASRVILSAGALRTPLILGRSGYRHPSLGKNLKTHPVFFTIGITPENRPVDPWVGSPSTVLVPVSKPGHEDGPMPAKLMRMEPPPTMSLTCLPWHSPQSNLTTMLSYRHCITLLTLVRDTDSSGTVTVTNPTTTISGGEGPPEISYTQTQKDRETAVHGLVLSCRLLLSGGCQTVIPCVPLPPHLASYTRTDGDDNAALESYLSAVRTHALKSATGWVSAHLMGTCAWGTVCDGGKGGKVSGIGNVYVADGSAFPSASGVNPMIAVMGIAEWAGRRVVEEVR